MLHGNGQTDGQTDSHSDYSAQRRKNFYTLYRSLIIVVLVPVNILSQIHPAHHNDANGMTPGSNLKITERHAVDYIKNAFWGTN